MVPSPIVRVAKLLASPQGRKAMKRANEEVRKQLADPKNKERLAKAKEQVQKQMADPKNKERIESLKSRLTGRSPGTEQPRAPEEK